MFVTVCTEGAKVNERVSLHLFVFVWGMQAEQTCDKVENKVEINRRGQINRSKSTFFGYRYF